MKPSAYVILLLFFDWQGSHSHANANAGAAADRSPELILLPGFPERNAAVAPGPRIPPLLLLLLHAYRKQVGSGFDGRLKTVAAGGWHGWMSEV